MAVSKKTIRFINGKRVSLRQQFFKGLNNKTDAHLIGTNSFRDIKNFGYATGALTHARGLKKFTILRNELDGTIAPCEMKPIADDAYIKFMALYRCTSNNIVNDRVLACSSQGDMYLYNLLDPSQYILYKENVTGNMSACNYNYEGKDILLFTTTNDMMFMYNGLVFMRIENSMPISSIAIHKERVFAVVPSKPHSVWFSEEFDPTNWNISLDEAGFINFSDEFGGVIKVVSMSDFLLIFREYGIFKLYATGAQENFYLTQLYHSTNKIHERTIAASENSVFFGTESGIMSTDGHTIRIINSELQTIVENASFDDAHSALCKNEYIIAMRTAERNPNKSIDEGFNDTLLMINIVNGSIEILKDIDVSSMITVNTRNANLVCIQLRDKRHRGVFFTFDFDKGTMYDYAMKKEYNSGIINFNDFSGEKLLENMQIYSKYDIEIQLDIDGESHRYAVKGGGYRQIQIEKFFNEFSYKIISSTEKAYILPPTFNIIKY